MKRLWISVAILILVFTLSSLSGAALKSLTSNVSDLLAQAEVAVLQEQWADAEELTQRAYYMWDEKNMFLYTTLRHLDADAIYVAFEQAQGALEIQNIHGYVDANKALQTKLWLMEETEGLSIENIL